MGRLRRCLIALLLAMSLTAPPAMAQQAVSLNQAVEMVREQSGGRVLRAETVQQGDRQVHRIRVLVQEGQVRVYRVDAATGRIR
ncbi:MAG: PepSY domain-containing protein [Ectothiorhodospiraceae bacterium]|nr:PepSY domain-containing protein [Ectothiorhodospiraceae bacterium]MCH8505828.1 PepSY domain-containing protein [Ectothiorhodospiraceae bacterium]